MRRLSLALALLAAVPLAAQTPDALIPPDSAVRTGTLANGLRFIVRQHKTPADRLELRLVVRAGSIQEDQDQRGLAHFIEHMAFNGTTRFKKNELISYLESIGVRFGADLNAYTSFDETVYILPVPTDKPELLERAFDILQDWASGVTFDSAAVVGERGVVLGEWRSGLSAGKRIQDKEFPLLFQGSRYAERLPIGDTATIDRATPAPLKRYFRDWYRPDLMAVIAVGDVPADRLEALIRDRFGKLTNPPRPRPRVDAPIPEQPGTRVSIVTDPELGSESIQLLVRRPSHGPYRREADERRALINGIVSTIAGQRLSDLARNPNAGFIGASIGPTRLIKDVELFAVAVGPKEGKLTQAFEEVLREARRLAQHGVLPAELERAKASLLRGREVAANEQDKAFSSAFVDSYVDAVASGSTTPSAKTRFVLAQRILPTITKAEVDAVLRDQATGTDRFLAARLPEKAGVSVPTREALLAVVAKTDTMTTDAWTETTVAGPLVPVIPKAGRIVSETTNTELGFTEWKLSNGIRVRIKPTTFKADEIIVSGWSPGGASLVSDADVLNAQFATVIVQQSGVGDLDAASLRRRLAGKVARVSANITDLSEGINGTTTPKDLDTFFELLWLNATAPRYDSNAVAAFVSQMKNQLAGRDRIPMMALLDTLAAVMTQNSPRQPPVTATTLAMFNPARAMALYKERFADFGDYTFVIVGNVQLDSLRPRVEQWLAALPATGRKESFKDVAPRPPAGVITKTIRKGKEPVAQQFAVYSGQTEPPDAMTELAAEAVGEILQTRLLETLREAMGATYSVNAMTEVSRRPHGEYSAMIQFTSKPEQVDSLWAAAQGIIAALRTDGPTADELQKFVAQYRRGTEVAVKTNGWWLGELRQAEEEGRPLAEILTWDKRLDALTPAMVRTAAQKFLDPKNLARFLLVPEPGTTP
ncbi:MAG: insulinase family protein [Gemmatimonadales bacterium]